MFRFRDSGDSGSGREQSPRLTRRQAEAAATLLLGAALAAVAFGAGGGSELSRTAITELLIVLAGGLVVAVALLWGGRGPLYGASSLGLFMLLAVVTALSITWSVVPELAYIEAGRTLAYLAAFAAGIAGARLAGSAGPALLKAIVIGALAAVAYALIARVWPASLAENEVSNRIGQPFQYWNAVGTTAALAIPGLLWLGSRRAGSAWGRALAYPGMGAALLAILLTQSRGALAAGAVGAIAWLAIVPLRLRSLAVLLVGGAGAAAVGAWALSKEAFAAMAQPLAVKEAVAGEFGLLLALMTVALLGAGYGVQVALARGLVPPRLRDRAGIAAVAAVGVVALLGLGVLAAGERGLTGTVSDRFKELTSVTDTAPAEQGAGRFTAASSTRGKYWREARLVFEDRPAVGTGAGTFRVARLRHRTDPSITAHAHGYVPQTLADLGLVGLVVSTLLLVAWLVAAVRATALYPRAPANRREWTAERCALVALVLMVTAFGLQSAIDWTWFVPGPAVMALVAAGFVAGRGPAGAAAAPPAAEPRRDLTEPPPRRVLAAAGVLLVALLCAWAIWQPEAGERATGRALTLLDRGDLESALLEVDRARAANPLSVEPLLLEASIETQGGLEREALETLEQAVLEFPGDPDTWYQLAAFQFGTLERPDLAIETVKGALYLDPESLPARIVYLDARAAARQQAAAAAAAP